MRSLTRNQHREKCTSNGLLNRNITKAKRLKKTWLLRLHLRRRLRPPRQNRVSGRLDYLVLPIRKEETAEVMDQTTVPPMGSATTLWQKLSRNQVRRNTSTFMIVFQHLTVSSCYFLSFFQEGSLELHHLAFHYSTTARWNLPKRDELELHRITQELLSELFKEEYPDQIGFVDVLSSSRLARRVFMFDVLVHFKNSYQMPSIAQVDTRVTNALQSGQPLNIKYLEMIRSMDSTIFETTISVHYISDKHVLDELIIDQRDEGSSEDHNGEDEEEDQDEESSDSNTVASDNGDNYVSNFYETNSSESSSGDKPFDQVPNFFVSLLLFVAGLVVVLLLATLYYYCRIRRVRTAPELERSDIEEHLETIKNKGISSYSTAAFSKDGIDNPEGLRASALAPYSVNRNKGGSRLPPPPPKNTELEEVSLLDDEHDGRPEQQSKGAKQQVSTQLTNPLSHNRRRTSEDQPGHFTGQRRIAAKQSTNPFNDSARPVDDQPQKLHEPQITHSTNPFSDNIKPVDYHRDPFNGKRTNDRPNKQRARTKQSTNQLRDNRNFLDTQPSTCSDKPGTLVKWSTNPFDDNERSYDDQPHPQQCSGTGTSVQKSLAQLDAVAREQKIRDELSVSSSLSESRASFFDSSLKAEQANPQQRIVVDSVPPPSPQSQFASPPVHTHEPKDMDDEEDFDSLPSVKDRMAMLSASMSLKGTTEVGNEEVASVRSNSKIPLVVNVQSSQTVVSKSSDRSVSYHNNKIYGGSPVQEVSSRSSTSSRARRRGSGQAPGAPKPVVPRRPRSPPPKQNTSLPSKEQESVPEWMRKFNEMGLAKGED